MDNDTSLINVLIAPNRFFGALGAGRERIGLPALIVLISALITGAGAYLMASSMTMIDVPDVDPATMQMITGAGAAFFAFFTVMLAWAIGSLIMHVIVKILGGTGSFKSTLSTVGYASLLQVFAGLLTLAVFLIYHPDVDAIAAGGVAALGTMAPVMAVTAIVGFVVMVWSVVIEAYGLVHAHDLPLGKALIAPAVMAIISMVLGLI